ncbi:O-antigen ligase family protein [Candidatus Saccharibacteria bacterium]|nr:O-antigen ligase family protein [Candidatus Saccharibacteria bacterium]
MTILTKYKAQSFFDKAKFIKIFLISSLCFCTLCWVQSILDCLGIDRNITLLCPGCTSYSFGFPHPSGLAIEPQFMGNLLLAPTLTALCLWARPAAKAHFFSRRALLFFSFFFSSTLFLTFSRGAIYSFTLGFIVLTLLSLIRLHNRAFLKTIPLLLLSFIFTLLMQGVFSAISYTNSTFASGIERSVSQLSLGEINLHFSNTDSDPATIDPSNSIAPVFDGYVEESTDVRVNLNRIAIDLATKSPSTLLFGYGLGSAGKVMFQAEKTSTPFEIIQNEYLSLLLETGILGLLLAVLITTLILLALRHIARPERYLIGCTVLCYLLTLLFFSGFPNAIHLYLSPVFLAASLLQRRPHRSSL